VFRVRVIKYIGWTFAWLAAFVCAKWAFGALYFDFPTAGALAVILFVIILLAAMYLFAENCGSSRSSFEEMHVDGSTSAQVFLYWTGVQLNKISEEHGAQRERTVYILCDSSIRPSVSSTNSAFNRQRQGISGRSSHSGWWVSTRTTPRRSHTMPPPTPGTAGVARLVSSRPEKPSRPRETD